LGFDSALADRLYDFFAPILYAWLFIGLVIAVLYHLSLYYIDGEFTIARERMLDVAVSILRALAYFVLWPGIIFFDRTALHRIWLFLLYLDPKQREENMELALALRERKYRRWIQERFFELDDVERRRRHELVTRDEHRQRTRTIPEGSPELDRYWMLTGVGTHPGAVRMLVRMYSDELLAEEVAAMARREVELRRPWNCLVCSTRVPAREVRLPELEYLRVVEAESLRPVVEGWALAGSYTMVFEECPSCDSAQPDLCEDLARFGRASDVVRQVRSGLTLHLDIS